MGGGIDRLVTWEDFPTFHRTAAVDFDAADSEALLDRGRRGYRGNVRSAPWPTLCLALARAKPVLDEPRGTT